jgi:hypothetical protein
MMNAIRQRVTVQPGGRIELYAPELEPGSHAEVIVLHESDKASGRRLLSALLGSGKGAFSGPEEADRFLSGERESWS